MNTMSPLDGGQDLAELVRTALRNIDLFDKRAMEGEVERVGRTTVSIEQVATYRTRFEDGLARIAYRQGWTPEQCAAVAALKRVCPPDRLYRVRGGFHSATRGHAPLGIIVSYRPGIKGGAAEAGVAVLGFANDLTGSAAHPFGVPREGLEDVTAEARAGTLPELHGSYI